MIGLRFSSLLLLSLLLVHLVPLSTALSVAPPPAPAPVVLPYSLWRGFIPSSIRYSNLTGLAYLVGSDYWVGVNANPYVVIANLSDGRILHRQHYIEQQPDALQLEYVDHLVHDRAGQPPVLVVLLYSMAELRSYVLRADGWTGGQLSFTALALDVVALGVDSSGKLLYTTVMEGDVVSAVDMQAGYAVQLLNATQGVANLVAGAVHPISGALYLHDLLQTDTEERNRLLVLSPSNNSILATFTLPPLNPLQDALLTSSAAIDSSGHYLDLFVTILHPDNVRDYVIWQFDVSNGSSIGPPFRTYDSTVLTAEVELGGAVSAGPRGDDWLLVDSLSREVYYQRDAARNESVLVGLPLLLFNFHTAVDERGHVYISTGDERSISVLEVAPNGDLLGQYFAGAVDCGHAGFYAPIAGVLHHPALGRRVLVPQCNRTVQVYDGETRQWLGQQATNQTVNLVIIAVHNAKAQVPAHSMQMPHPPPHPPHIKLRRAHMQPSTHPLPPLPMPLAAVHDDGLAQRSLAVGSAHLPLDPPGQVHHRPSQLHPVRPHPCSRRRRETAAAVRGGVLERAAVRVRSQRSVASTAPLQLHVVAGAAACSLWFHGAGAVGGWGAVVRECQCGIWRGSVHRGDRHQQWGGGAEPGVPAHRRCAV